MTTKRLAIVLGIILLAALAVWFAISQRQTLPLNYEECVARGYTVQETSPKYCVTPEGQKFAEPMQADDTTPVSGTPSPSGTSSNFNPDSKDIRLVIHFSKEPNSSDDFTYTETVNRTTNRKDMGTYTIEQLIAGPTSTEQARGLYSPIAGKLSGDSNCNGKDFSLAVDEGIATLKFCRSVTSAGVGDDAQITNTITKTLRQFSSVQNVIILTSDNNCFGDMSGDNMCFER